MTREDLTALLEQFAVCVIQVSRVDLTPDEQYTMIADSIEMVADTVMFCTDKSRITQPSVN